MKSKKSDYSKNTQKKIIILRIIDIILLVVPLVVFLGIGLFSDQAILVEKVTLVGTTMIALILVIFNILAKTHLRSAIWIMIIGLYVAIDDLMPLIICLAIATILDEFVFEPTIKRLKTKYIASRTLDDRGIGNE